MNKNRWVKLLKKYNTKKYYKEIKIENNKYLFYFF